MPYLLQLAVKLADGTGTTEISSIHDTAVKELNLQQKWVKTYNIPRSVQYTIDSHQ
jgi:hypothetical protein